MIPFAHILLASLAETLPFWMRVLLLPMCFCVCVRRARARAVRVSKAAALSVLLPRVYLGGAYSVQADGRLRMMMA